jgi:DNA repair exonuclease SbcCD ATPase subunit
MITFNNISFRNFLSYGNAMTTISLANVKNTLYVGSNGAGKSVILEVICYALFGKPYRSIRLPQLLNSINTKGLLAEITFSVGTIAYRVVRGMKPAVFEIYRDGVLIGQEAATRDYQGYLEKTILKINYKTFCQVVILGTTSFTPFMQLSTSARRDVIEDVLDIAVFSAMNSNLKAKAAITREEITSISNKIELAKRDTIAQKKIISYIKEAKTSRVYEEELEIEKLTASLDTNEASLADYMKTLGALKLSCPNAVSEVELNAAMRVNYRYIDEEKKISDRLKNILDLHECPTCYQNVGHDHKSSVEVELQNRLEVVRSDVILSKSVLDKLREAKTLWSLVDTEIRNVTSEVTTLNATIASLNESIAKKESLIASIKNNTSDVMKETAKLKEIADNALFLIKEKNELLEERDIQDITLSLLKDTGIKAAIIKEYVPLINRFVNTYLEGFNLYINFTLDENFNETILSRGRDDFSYASFSEGEKAKIDLAIMFSFRQISELKNSANCNLLVLDEYGSSVLDTESVDMFMEILASLPDTNTLVISHAALQYEIFDSVFRIAKRGDFSEVEQLI